MQLHSVSYQDVTSEAEARFRLRSAAQLASSRQRSARRSRRAGGADWGRVWGGADGEGVEGFKQEEASAGQMGERFWEAGQEAVALGGKRTHPGTSMRWRPAGSAVSDAA